MCFGWPDVTPCQYGTRLVTFDRVPCAWMKPSYWPGVNPLAVNPTGMVTDSPGFRGTEAYGSSGTALPAERRYGKLEGVGFGPEIPERQISYAVESAVPAPKLSDTGAKAAVELTAANMSRMPPPACCTWACVPAQMDASGRGIHQQRAVLRPRSTPDAPP